MHCPGRLDLKHGWRDPHQTAKVETTTDERHPKVTGHLVAWFIFPNLKLYGPEEYEPNITHTEPKAPDQQFGDEERDHG